MSPTLQRCLGAIGLPVPSVGFRTERRTQARYTGGSGGYQRSSPTFTAQHVYKEITPTIRRRLVDDSGDLTDNSPFIRGLLERLVVYVIGSGIWPYSSTGDEAFDRDADAAFADFAEHCEYRGGINWPMLQAQLYRTELRDGDAGVILTTDSFKSPKVFAVEGRDIGDSSRANSDKMFDGVILGPKGERLGFVVRSESPTGVRSVVDVIRANFVHQFDPERPGQVRGVPILSSALNTGRDIHDILALEKAAVKDASSKTDIIKNQSGEADPDETIRTGGVTLNGSDGEDGAKYYREIFGPEAKYIKTGDEWQAYQSDRPGPAWQGFMSFLSETVCLAARIPPSVLLQIKVGGADTRRDLAAAARVFEMSQNRIARQHLRIRNFVLSVSLDTRKAPVGWRDAVIWQMPKSITVDAGREALNDREDVRAGLMTKQEYQGRWGTDWRRHADQLMREATDTIKRAKELSVAEGIPFELALSLLGYQQNSPQIAQPAPQPQGITV